MAILVKSCTSGKRDVSFINSHYQDFKISSGFCFLLNVEREEVALTTNPVILAEFKA